MAPPKRKSPDRKPARKSSQPSAVARMLRSGVAAITRHPRLIGGLAVFGVVFSFVAANALWYQPKPHPSPLLATRMLEKTATKVSTRAVDEEPGVTTFRIQRMEDLELEKAPARTESKPAPSALVRDIQQALTERGLYDGALDGLMGPKTVSAILFFQESEGLQPTGKADKALLAKIREHNPAVGVIPDERPSMDHTASTTRTNEDDIAALIRATDSKPAPTKKEVARKPADRKAAPDSTGAAPVERVMLIQKGLASMAYAGVKVDGIAGEATRAAIRAFEKSYRLPVTGEPSERVLNKLKAIGAI